MLGLLYTSRGIALLAAPPCVAWAFVALDGHEVPLLLVALLGGLGTLLLGAAARARLEGRPT